ncbi:unnamed protein product [Linum tenue]|uniref:Uncharacterized protein n=1 Tax=Linum tenue TaxID=586396 RepID=A0AAV0MTG1_9ROSI|nr:unnamed protein product [Linum tenue]
MAFGFYNISLHEDSIALATFKTVQRNVFIATSAGIVGTLSRALHNGIPWVLTSPSSSIRLSIDYGSGSNFKRDSRYPGLLCTLEITALAKLRSSSWVHDSRSNQRQDHA